MLADTVLWLDGGLQGSFQVTRGTSQEQRPGSLGGRLEKDWNRRSYVKLRCKEGARKRKSHSLLGVAVEKTGWQTKAAPGALSLLHICISLLLSHHGAMHPEAIIFAWISTLLEPWVKGAYPIYNNVVTCNLNRKCSKMFSWTTNPITSICIKTDVVVKVEQQQKRDNSMSQQR